MADFQELFEKLPDGVTLHDASDGSILETNQQFCEMLGYSRPELLALEFQDLHVDEPPYTSEKAEDYIRKAADEGPQTFEWLDKTKSGDPLPVEVHLSLTTIDGEERVLAVIRDITERKQHETALQREQDRSTALFQNSLDPVVYCEYVEGTPIVRDANPAFRETFGYDIETAIDSPIDELVVPDDSAKMREAAELNRRIQEGERLETEVRRQTVDGVKDFRFRSIPFDSGEDGHGTYGIYSDITARKERERTLEQYRMLVEAVGDPMYVLDQDGFIEIVNQPCADLGGTTRKELVGSHVTTVMSEADADRGTDLIRELLRDPERTSGTYEITVKPIAGEPFPAEVNLGLILDDDGEYLGSAGVVRDLSDHKARERQLERQNERLDEFANVVSHDLRNPLSVASGRLELAREDCDSEHLDTAARAHDRMDTLIEDLLALARAGETIRDRQVVDLDDVVEDCWRTVDTRDAALTAQANGTIRADETRLRQLLENLFRNAIEHGGDEVAITVGDLNGGFFVEDDGRGIPEDIRDQIFDAGFSSSPDGTGFGLSIVNQVVDAHGWEVTATTGEDGGARIEIADVEFE